MPNQSTQYSYRTSEEFSEPDETFDSKNLVVEPFSSFGHKIENTNLTSGPLVRLESHSNQLVRLPDEQAEPKGRQPDSEWAEILAEDQMPLPDRYPDEYARYKELFYDFCKKSPYHIKTSYKSGFIAPRQKKNKQGEMYSPWCYEDLLIRHLDPERWLASHPYEFAIDQPDVFCLGLRFGDKTKLGCIDFDNKTNVIGVYNTCMVGSDVAQPLPILTLEHVQKIERLYDTFPNRIWCISSATLGLHIWERFTNLKSHRKVEARYRPKLRHIGLRDVEVYPSPRLSHQVLRRPFGKDYYTITDIGLLSDWVDQLEHFDNPSTPAFASIVTSLVDLARREWHRYHRQNGLFLTKSSVNSLNIDDKSHLKKFVYDDVAIPAAFLSEVARIEDWVASGCPKPEPVTSTCSGFTCINKPDSDQPEFSTDCQPVVNKKKGWIEQCIKFATEGLPKDDSLLDAISKLARWFYFVEFFDVPSTERIVETTALLEEFALTKHNGFITTLNNGLIADVESRVGRIVQRAIATSTEQDLFFRIREKRRLGQYANKLMLEPVIRGTASTSTCSGYTCNIKEIDDSPLPDSIHRRLMKVVKSQQMRRRNGEYPFIKFSRRLLNALSKAGGEARIHRDVIFLFMEGKNPNQQHRYKSLLASHGLIYPGWDQYVVQGKRSSLYRLRRPVAKVLGLHRHQRNRTL